MINDIKAPPGGGRPTQRRASSPEGDSGMSEDIDTAAIEATGVTPASGEGSEKLVVDSADLGEDTGSSTDGSEKLVVTNEDLDGDSTSELGGTAVGDTLGDLLTSDDVDAGDQIPETAIADKDMAEEMAYAEKPFQDAKREHAESLTSENQELLDWLSSEAAEKAMTNYIEGKNQMSEAELVLREKAEPFGVLRKTYEQKDENFEERSLKIYENDPERKAMKLKIAEKNLKAVVDLQVEAVMSDDTLSPAERLKKIKGIASTRDVVRDSLVHEGGGRTGNIYPEELLALIEWGGGREEDKQPRLWGRVVSGLAQDNGYIAVEAVRMIAAESGVDFGEVFEQVAPMIAESLKLSGNRNQTNSHIESLGYIWSDRFDKYVKFDM